jgi:hypothetical protein
MYCSDKIHSNDLEVGVIVLYCFCIVLYYLALTLSLIWASAHIYRIHSPPGRFDFQGESSFLRINSGLAANIVFYVLLLVVNQTTN